MCVWGGGAAAVDLSIRRAPDTAVTTGSRLLSADADGRIKCWSMADHLANSWESSVGSQVEGDPIVALSWLHNGVKLALHVEKVRDPLRTEGRTGWRCAALSLTALGAPVPASGHRLDCCSYPPAPPFADGPLQ